MKHLAQIQSEFTKIAVGDWWDQLSHNQQHSYIGLHPGTQKRVTVKQSIPGRLENLLGLAPKYENKSHLYTDIAENTLHGHPHLQEDFKRDKGHDYSGESLKHYRETMDYFDRARIQHEKDKAIQDRENRIDDLKHQIVQHHDNIQRILDEDDVP